MRGCCMTLFTHFYPVYFELHVLKNVEMQSVQMCSVLQVNK